MTEHNKAELRMLSQIFLAIFMVADYGLFLRLNNSEFPWFALAGASVGLSIILFCWVGKKYVLFNVVLLAGTAIYSIAYNWSALFNIH
ncbi:MAG TPA: hypothetical protein VEV44_15195 [Pseudoneobacillus sp.]|nr:hypothetical protein [Pseudoneobacillus sp.]